MVTLLASLPISTRADVQCQATTPINNQARARMKHRLPVALPVAHTHVNVQDMIMWPLPQHMATLQERNANVPIDPRETHLFSITGDVWRVKVEDNDCDFHVEMSAPDDFATGNRVIVEIPQGSAFTATRDEVIAALRAAGTGDLESTPELNLQRPIRLAVLGFAFWDGTHWTHNNPKKGHGHGTQYVQTLWELHPVIDVKIAPITQQPITAMERSSIIAETPPTPSPAASDWIAVGTSRVNMAAISAARISPDNTRTTLSNVGAAGMTTIAESRDTAVATAVQTYLRHHATDWFTGHVSEDAGSDTVYVRRASVLRIDPTPAGHGALIVSAAGPVIAGYVNTPP